MQLVFWDKDNAKFHVSYKELKDLQFPSIPSLLPSFNTYRGYVEMTEMHYYFHNSRNCVLLQVVKLLWDSDGREETSVHLNKSVEKTADVFVICT